MITPLVAVARPVERSISTVSLPDRDLMFKSWRSGAACARTTAAQRNAIERSGRGRVIKACFKIRRGPVFGQKAGWRGATREHTRHGSVTEEQRSQTAFCPKTLRAAGLLPVAGG